MSERTGASGPIVAVLSALARAPRLLRFAAFALREVVLANLRVARIVLTPRPRLRPGIVAVPLEPATDAQITVLANLITLTPGTLSVEVSEDRRTLFVHAIDVESPEAFRRETKQGFERAVAELWR